MSKALVFDEPDPFVGMVVASATFIVLS